MLVTGITLFCWGADMAVWVWVHAHAFRGAYRVCRMSCWQFASADFTLLQPQTPEREKHGSWKFADWPEASVGETLSPRHTEQWLPRQLEQTFSKDDMQRATGTCSLSLTAPPGNRSHAGAAWGCAWGACMWGSGGVPRAFAHTRVW